MIYHCLNFLHCFQYEIPRFNIQDMAQVVCYIEESLANENISFIHGMFDINLSCIYWLQRFPRRSSRRLKGASIWHGCYTLLAKCVYESVSGFIAICRPTGTDAALVCFQQHLDIGLIYGCFYQFCMDFK